MEIDGKENLVKGAQVSKSPGKPTGQFIKSPGPKVAKLLDIFASGSPRPHDSDSEPESADKEELKYDFEKAQAKRVKKMRAAQAARLNESYMEASMVISNLLKSEEGEDDSSDVESANEIEATSSLTNQVETPKNRAQDVKKSLFSSSAEVEHPGFDVQKFLKNLNNKTTNEESAANSGSSRTDVIQREAASGQNEESPRPTAALAYFHLVSAGDRIETPSKRPKLGSSARMQNLLSSFENVDDPIRPKSCTLQRNNDNVATESKDSPAKHSTEKPNFPEEIKLDIQMKTENKPQKSSHKATTPKKPQVSSYVSSMITQLQNSHGKKRTDSDSDQDFESAEECYQSEEKSKKDTPQGQVSDEAKENKVSKPDLNSIESVTTECKQNLLNSHAEDRAEKIVKKPADARVIVVVKNEAKKTAITENESESRVFLARERDLCIDPSMSELQKMLLQKSRDLKRQPVPKERAPGLELGKVVGDSSTGTNSRQTALTTASGHLSVKSSVLEDEGDELMGGGRRVEFNSELDIKSATSDSFSNYSCSASAMKDQVFPSHFAYTSNSKLEETNDSIYSKLNFSRRSEMDSTSSETTEATVNDWVSRPYIGAQSRLGNKSYEDESEYASTSSEFLSLPRLTATAENERQSFKKLPTSTSQQFESKTCRDLVNERDNNCTYSTIRSASSTCANSGDSTIHSSSGGLGGEYDVSDVDCTLVSEGSEQAAAVTASVLMDEIEAQQKIIQQVSRALNIAETRNSCKNSEEQIEAERVLLLSHARQEALKNELTALRNYTLLKRNRSSERQLESGSGFSSSTETIDKPLPCYGNITLSNINIPLKRDEMFHLNLTKHNIHYVCLIRYKTQVIATQLVSAGSDYKAVTFANMITFRNVDPKFELVIEVWGYSCLNIADKGHQSQQSNKDKRKKTKLHSAEKRKAAYFLTSPFVKKAKHSTDTPGSASKGSGHHNAKQMATLTFSPAATPGYRQMGFKKAAQVVLTKKNCNSKELQLEQIECDDIINPLKGTMGVSCDLYPFFQMEFKGFLNMEDVNKGIWHMRWCALTNTKLCYWKFAENEAKRAPIGCVDLRRCVEVVEVSRSVCAIPHAFALNMQEPYQSDPSCVVNYRQLLCTDSKESKLEWIRNLEIVILNLKTWSQS
ncbi:anillin-like isoform X2 [Symsagittifera roscoffensis]|uniref:anillin-like isoform X2 n=1 Tax=Symsagittifera roscoffensis TaxID=84072 RepID=UPI00307B8BD0